MEDGKGNCSIRQLLGRATVHLSNRPLCRSPRLRVIGPGGLVLNGASVHAPRMLKRLSAAIVLSVIAVPSLALAQEAATPAPPPLSASTGIKNLYGTVRGYIVGGSRTTSSITATSSPTCA